MGTAFLDLDRTLLVGASGPTLQRALIAAGVVPSAAQVPGLTALYGIFDRFGESLFSMGLARSAAAAAKGWKAEEVRAAATDAVPELLERCAPYAAARLDGLRAEGCRLVLATASPADMVEPLAVALGFDDVIATRYEVDDDGRYTGRLLGSFVWGLGKVRAVQSWATAHGEDLSTCYAFSDSFFDTPLLSSVGHPHPVNPDIRLLGLAKLRRWPIESWERPDSVPSLFGFEAYDVLRPLVRPELFPYARFTFDGLEHLPVKGPAILAANHRSYFDVAALALVAARLGRPVRALAKAELFDAPIISTLARALGAICVDRTGDPSEAYEAARVALEAGEVIIILPQGTIPQGAAFFDPQLVGKTGTARLAAATKAPVVPIGLWGTEAVWPRSTKIPRVATVFNPPEVAVRVGAPASLEGLGIERATEEIMAAISSLLPEAQQRRSPPRHAELAATYPSGRIPEDGRTGRDDR